MITTRFLGITDYELYGSWLREQSEETLATYFGIATNPTYINQLVDGIVSNPEEHYFLVAVQGTTWVGVIHMARISETQMEFGIMVAEQYRGQGIANQLMSEAITWIRNRGFDTLYLHCVAWNLAMKHLAYKHGLVMHEDHGDTEVRTHIPPPSMISYAQEAATRNRNIFIMGLQQSWFPFNEPTGLISNKYIMTEIIATLVMVQITIACVTLYLHRSQAHRGVTFHPVVEHVMRFWLWLTTGMVTKQWVAIHRRHHQKSDQTGDPHSPQIYGIRRVLFGGAFLYHEASKDKEMVDQLSHGTPNDWVERNVYAAHSRLGIMIMLIVDLYLFGLWGWLVWGIQMIWVPFWAAGVINGLAHWWGYRLTNTKDTSTNLWPLAIWIGGEELHNGHHADGANPKFSQRWWEFDIGWMYICILRNLGLAKLRV